MNFKFILFVPLIEIILFIFFGDFLGFFNVIFLILLTGFIGFFLIKSNIRLNDLSELIREPNEWVYKKIAGILLIIPGFLTDFLGILLLFKQLRKIAWKILINNNSFKNKSREKNTDVIDAEYKDLDER